MHDNKRQGAVEISDSNGTIEGGANPLIYQDPASHSYAGSPQKLDLFSQPEKNYIFIIILVIGTGRNLTALAIVPAPAPLYSARRWTR
jgi:hypothetical protein